MTRPRVLGALALLIVAGVVVAVLSVSSDPFRQVSYGTGSPLQTLAVYSAPAPKAPLVVLVHGGGWKSFDQKYLVSDALDLRKAGYAVVVANYRTDSATVPAFPNESNDVVAATRWAITHASSFNADPSHVILMGGSAGSTLVGLAAEQLNTTKAGTVETVVTLSGAMDFTHLLPLDMARATALGCSGSPCTPAMEAQWSPANNVTATNCPSNWLVINSAHEVTPLTQANTMVEALHAHGCNATEVVRKSGHAFAYWNSELATILSFVKGSLAPLG